MIFKSETTWYSFENLVSSTAESNRILQTPLFLSFVEV